MLGSALATVKSPKPPCFISMIEPTKAEAVPTVMVTVS
ncbi:hypothetical protein BJQ89_03248 [Arthrobacter sp. ES1]|nr:hypothetical protein [Arthrobacter sp. ES1]